jgi:hypothetical protein
LITRDSPGKISNSLRKSKASKIHCLKQHGKAIKKPLLNVFSDEFQKHWSDRIVGVSTTFWYITYSENKAGAQNDHFKSLPPK